MAEANAFKLHTLYCKDFQDGTVDPEYPPVVCQTHLIFKINVAVHLLSFSGRPVVVPPPVPHVELHFLREHPSKMKCRFKRCNNTSKYSCGGCVHKGGPMYLCLIHLREHQESERVREMLN